MNYLTSTSESLVANHLKEKLNMMVAKTLAISSEKSSLSEPGRSAIVSPALKEATVVFTKTN